MAKTKPAASAMAFLQKAVSLPQENVPFKESFEVKKPDAMSSFRGMFGEAHLSLEEKSDLKKLLEDFHEPQWKEESQIDEDFDSLLRVTTEIKAINNQSILLHGERIKKAQSVLKNYKEGAFTKWLVTTYGNRQTPYSMLQYYEMYQELPHNTRLKVENMPRKAAYVLAAREGELDKKIEFIESVKGETQKALIVHIQAVFPLHHADKRQKQKPSNHMQVLIEIENYVSQLEKMKTSLSTGQKVRIFDLINRLKELTK